MRMDLIKKCWLEMADSWDHPQPNTEHHTRNSAGEDGLCLDIKYGKGRNLTQDEQDHMIEQIHLLPDHTEAPRYKWPWTLKGAKARAEYCREQAAKIGDND